MMDRSIPKEDEMDENMNEGRDLVHRAAEAWLDANELILVTLIALEVDEPVEDVADLLGDAVQLDDVGMRVVPASVCREFLAGRAEQAARIQDQARRLQESLESLPVPVGIAAIEDGSAMEAIAAGDPNYSTPRDEFAAGRERPNFMVEAIEQGERQLAAAKRAAADKKADRDR